MNPLDPLTTRHPVSPSAAPIKPTRPKVYESAVDRWILVFLMLTPTLAAAIGIYAWTIGRPGDAFILFLTGAISGLVTVAVALPCRYTLLDDAVSIRCGLICYQIPYADIVSVEPTWTIRSGPALSMRRVDLKTKTRSIILSPKNREGFIADVEHSIETLA